MTECKDLIVDVTQFFQSLLWVSLIAWLVYYFRKDIRFLVQELQRRIASAQQVELGPLKLQRIEDKVTTVAEDMNIAKQFLLSMSESMYKNLVKIASG
jgi:hypothetical protein